MKSFHETSAIQLNTGYTERLQPVANQTAEEWGVEHTANEVSIGLLSSNHLSWN